MCLALSELLAGLSGPAQTCCHQSSPPTLPLPHNLHLPTEEKSHSLFVVRCLKNVPLNNGRFSVINLRKNNEQMTLYLHFSLLKNRLA